MCELQSSDWNVFVDMKDGWILSHIFLPATIYIYSRNPWLVFTLIYVWESIELTLSYMGVDALSEDRVDTLIIDPLSALIGVLVAHAVVVSKTKDCDVDLTYKILHPVIIAASSFACLAEQEWIGFLVFILVYAASSYVMYRLYPKYTEFLSWTLFSALSMVIIATLVLAIGKAAPIVAFTVPIVLLFFWSRTQTDGNPLDIV
tara:strand:+ start:1694 stop:2302 length:609 start_codon:yes stop_codon:yes gene_type:complete